MQIEAAKCLVTQKQEISAHTVFISRYCAHSEYFYKYKQKYVEKHA